MHRSRSTANTQNAIPGKLWCRNWCSSLRARSPTRKRRKWFTQVHLSIDFGRVGSTIIVYHRAQRARILKMDLKIKGGALSHSDSFVACSNCFSNEGLRLDAERLGEEDSSSCPRCMAADGRKLSTKRLIILTQIFSSGVQYASSNTVPRR